MTTSRVLSGEEVRAFLEGLIHPPKQVGPTSVVLTVRAVEAVVGPGFLDFGGGERKPLECEALEPVREEGEPHGWWELDQGRYRLTYNETGEVPSGCAGLLVAWKEALLSGLAHPAVFLPAGSKVPAVLAAVGAVGLNLKENARASELVVFRTD